ncbi:hypothetical protein ACWFNE_07640 [Cellulomonas sp. NPDC055163]
MRRLPGTVAVLACGVALGLAGCSSPTPEQNVEEACAASDELDVALADLRASLTPDSTVDSIRDAQAAVDAAADELRQQTIDIAEDRADAVEEARIELGETIDGIDSDSSVSEAVESLRTGADEVREALSSLVDELDCPTATSS